MLQIKPVQLKTVSEPYLEAELLTHQLPVSLPQAGVADRLEHKQVHLELLNLGSDSIGDSPWRRGVREQLAQIVGVLVHLLNLRTRNTV